MSNKLANSPIPALKIWSTILTSSVHGTEHLLTDINILDSPPGIPQHLAIHHVVYISRSVETVISLRLSQHEREWCTSKDAQDIADFSGARYQSQEIVACVSQTSTASTSKDQLSLPGTSC